MFGRKSATALCSFLVAVLVSGLMHASYPWVLASEEARKSLEVTKEQRDELDAALKNSDRIALSIIGVAICCTLCAGYVASPSRAAYAIPAAVVGGAIAGALSCEIGYWFHGNFVERVADPMVHVVARLGLMFIPICIAAGATAVTASGLKSDFTSAAAGGLLGTVTAAALYVVLSGVVTPLELVRDIMPGHSINRSLLIVLFIPAICSLALRQSWQDARKLSNMTGPQPTSPST